jgi:glycosyltransferase involved in cell wall biosynthesis
VSCSEEAVREHKRIGYAADRIVVIRNGCDLSHFKPEPEAGAQLRAGWSVKQDEILIGTVARWDPYKDHENLFRALALLREQGRQFRCVLVGKGMEAGNLELARMIGNLDLADRMILTGPREDIPAVMSAFDLHVLSSCGEAFPNTVAEAMACGTPCVVTDVGDAAEIVGECGWVAPPNDASALAQSIDSALNALASGERTTLLRRCRSRIEEHFGLDRMVSAYHDLWTELVRENARAR